MSKKLTVIVSQNYCKLYLTEKFFIIQSLYDRNLLNKRSQLVCKYGHQNNLLCNAEEMRIWMNICSCILYLHSIFNIFLLFTFRHNSDNICMNCVWWMQQHETLSSIHITSFRSILINFIWLWSTYYLVPFGSYSID